MGSQNKMMMTTTRKNILFVWFIQGVLADSLTTTISSCPKEEPTIGSPCEKKYLNCDYGSITCCDESFPDITFFCNSDGTWGALQVEIYCNSEDCPLTTEGQLTTEAAVAEDCSKTCNSQPSSPVCGTDGVTYSSMCSAECENVTVSCQGECPCNQPLLPQGSCPKDSLYNSPCTPEQEGLRCEYGEHECCGVRSPNFVMECFSGLWAGYYVDTLCVLGYPCEDTSSTTTSSSILWENR